MKRIGIIGTRGRDNQQDIAAVTNAFFDAYEKGDIIVSGGCPKGGDRFAESIAKELGIKIKIHPAEWEKFGKGAGFVRNTLIAKDSDVIIACVSENRRGGTEDTIAKFLNRLKINEYTAKKNDLLVLV